MPRDKTNLTLLYLQTSERAAPTQKILQFVPLPPDPRRMFALPMMVEDPDSPQESLTIQVIEDVLRSLLSYGFKLATCL